jgi:hypothetical protein
MKLKLALALLALGIFAAPPVRAQHGHGGGSSHGGDMGHASSSHSSSHESEADEHGGKHDADDHGGKHDGDHSHGSLAAKLAKNTQLSAKLQSLLPPGTNLATAAAGFKNLGQFVAAVHVAKNLGIPFDQLKAKLTGPGSESLGKAIQDLKPGVDAKAALKQAEKEAKLDLKSTDHDADEHNAGVDADKHDADDTKPRP